LLVLLAAALTVAGCSGSGSSSQPGSGTSGTSATVTALIPTTAGSITAPPAGGLTATLTTGTGAPAGTTVTLSSSLTAPVNALFPASVRRTASVANATPFFYLTLTFSANLPVSTFTSQTLVLNGQPANSTFFEEIDDTTTSPASKIGASQGTLGTGSVSFLTPSTNLSFVTGHTYTFMYYYIPGISSPPPTATPTASPTPVGATPSPTPTAFATATPTPVGATPSPTPTATPTPGPTSAATAVAANTVVSINIPSVGGFTGTTQIGNFNVDTTLTLQSYLGLASGLASPTTSGTVIFTEAFSASPTVTVNNTNCANCQQTIPLTITPTLNVIAAASGKTFYVAECNATGCPVSPADNVAIALSGPNLVVTAQTFHDINGFTSLPTDIVFYYQ